MRGRAVRLEGGGLEQDELLGEEDRGLHAAEAEGTTGEDDPVEGPGERRLAGASDGGGRRREGDAVLAVVVEAGQRDRAGRYIALVATCVNV